MKYFYSTLVLAALVAAAGVSLVWAGTYNFYFNNTEQGANSTASPSLTVSADGKATSTGAQQTVSSTDGKLVPDKNPAAGSSVVPAAPVTTAESAPAQRESDPDFRHFRLELGGTKAIHRYQYGYTTDEQGLLAAVGISFTRELGVNFFGSRLEKGRWFGGADFEITPIRASLFRMENFLELTGLVGASTLDQVYYGAVLLAHVGARVNLNLGHQFGVTAVVRQSLGGSDGTNFMGEAGLIVRL
jgi:hypothetical protein